MIYDYELARTSLVKATDFFATLCAIASLILLTKLRSHEGDTKTKGMLVKVFGLLAFTFIFYVIAEIWYRLTESFGFPDFFWIAGYLIEFIAFYYFVIYMYSEKNKTIEGFLKLNLSLLASGIISYYLLYTTLPFEVEISELEKFVGYVYPILSTLIAIVSLFVYSFFRDTGRFGTAILLMVSSNIIAFLADGMWLYYTAIETYGIVGVLSDTMYAVYYATYAFAFYLLIKQLSIKEHEKQA